MAERMAGFCLAYGVQPSEYMELTRLQRHAFNEEAKRINEAMKRK